MYPDLASDNFGTYNKYTNVSRSGINNLIVLYRSLIGFCICICICTNTLNCPILALYQRGRAHVMLLVAQCWVFHTLRLQRGYTAIIQLVPVSYSLREIWMSIHLCITCTINNFKAITIVMFDYVMFRFWTWPDNIWSHNLYFLP